MDKLILYNMEEGASYESVLQEAKEKAGYAEPDPSLDVNGTGCCT